MNTKVKKPNYQNTNKQIKNRKKKTPRHHPLKTHNKSYKTRPQKEEETKTKNTPPQHKQTTKTQTHKT